MSMSSAASRRFRDHDGEGFAGVTCTVIRERQLRDVADRQLSLERDEARALPLDRIGGIRHVRDRAMAVGQIIGRGEDRDHSRRSQRGGCVDRADPGVSVR
jgi:hypothetical protein